MAQDLRLSEEQSTQRRAQILGFNYVDTSQLSQRPLYKDVLMATEIKHDRVVPLQADRSTILFGITTTTSQQVIRQLQQRFIEQRVTMAIISDSGFREYVELYDPPKQIVYHDIDITKSDDVSVLEQVSHTLEQVRADDMLAYLVQQAHRLNASDIHLETQEDFARIRFRIDGVLHVVARLSYEKYRILLSAIASAGNVSTASDEAQQGHISQRVAMADGNQVPINLRLETVPTINGTDVVMRLFNMDQSSYQLDRLGLTPAERAKVDDVIRRPTGLVMVVGPTGSGKTTTLYSMLNSLNSEERKIITIEDPVEYQFAGISQISVRSQQAGNDNSFAEKLRAVLRLDPDIVMVGEVRDMDTAKTALQAALTGHLVLSTFHASSAAAALTRLEDIIGQNPLFVSAIRLVMAQRLVRRLDDATKVPYTPDERTTQYLHQMVASLPPNIERPNLTNIQLYEPGKSADNPYGFTGQIAIREQFTMDGAVRDLLQDGTKMKTTDLIEQAAVASGMLTMRQDAILKVIAGQTTMTEVFRVLG